MPSGEFFGALSQRLGRAPITIRKLLAYKPAQESIEHGRVRHYFTRAQYQQALDHFAAHPFIGRGKHGNHRRKA